MEAQSSHIHLIISDIMMPVMDGYNFLEAVKKDENFAAIPFIMLTALNDIKYKLKGLRIGIDDYLTKPFVEEELIARIDNLINYADEKKAFQLAEEALNAVPSVGKKQLLIEGGAKMTLEDMEWLTDLENVVRENISNSSYTVDKLAKELAMSRSLVYRKIKTLTGLTPNNYINQVRFEQAR